MTATAIGIGHNGGPLLVRPKFWLPTFDPWRLLKPLFMDGQWFPKQEMQFEGDGIPIGGFDPPGSQSFTVVGADSFVVPNYSTSLTITLWGGGASGLGAGGAGALGSNGAASTVASLSLSAGGGQCARP